MLGAFDLSQRLVEVWRGSNSDVQRQLLDCVSLNRTLSDVSLCLVKRKPFDIFAERPILKNSRGDCRSFEPAEVDGANSFVPLLEMPESRVLWAIRMSGVSF